MMVKIPRERLATRLLSRELSDADKLWLSIRLARKEGRFAIFEVMELGDERERLLRLMNPAESGAAKQG